MRINIIRQTRRGEIVTTRPFGPVAAFACEDSVRVT
jgi:hypothetical protein